MTVFANLLLAHLIADFPLQTTPLFRWKMRNLSGATVHGMAHLFMNALVFAPSLGRVWPALAVLFALHVLQDRAKVTTGGEDVNSPAPFLLDQALHYALLAAAAILPPLRGAVPLFTKAVALAASGAVAATFAGTILTFIVARRFPLEKRRIEITGLRKSFDLLTLGLIYGGVLYGRYGLAGLGLLARGLVTWRATHGPFGSLPFELGVGPAWATLLGLLARMMTQSV